MSELVIKGDKKYIKYLSKHLAIEHPTVVGRMLVRLEGKKKRGCKK